MTYGKAVYGEVEYGAEPAAVSGAIAAALSVAAAVGADLKGRGAMTANLPAAFSIAGDLKAVGALNAALETAFEISADATGRGALLASMAVSAAVQADLTKAGELSASLSMVVAVTAALRDASAPDRLADPRIVAERIRARPKRRFYKDRFNQFAETFDAFLRRQEPEMRARVLAEPRVEKAREAFVADPRFRNEIAAMATAVSAREARISAEEVLEGLEEAIDGLMREIRDEEDVIAIISLLATTDQLLT